MKHLRVDKYGWVNIYLVRRLGDLGISALNCASRGLGLSSDWDIVLPRQDCSLNPTNQEFRLVAMDFQAISWKTMGGGRESTQLCRARCTNTSLVYHFHTTVLLWFEWDDCLEKSKYVWNWLSSFPPCVSLLLKYTQSILVCP